MATITVHKNDHNGEHVWQYDGEVIQRGATWVCLQARFGRGPVDIGVVTFRKGDLMTEWFYSDRYYNIFQIQDVDDDRIKGWYCNITRPATITAGAITSDDLALDVFVAPDGTITLLDEDEYVALDLPINERQAVTEAVTVLRDRVKRRESPFDSIPS